MILIGCDNLAIKRTTRMYCEISHGKIRRLLCWPLCESPCEGKSKNNAWSKKKTADKNQDQKQRVAGTG